MRPIGGRDERAWALKANRVAVMYSGRFTSRISMPRKARSSMMAPSLDSILMPSRQSVNTQSRMSKRRMAAMDSGPSRIAAHSVFIRQLVMVKSSLGQSG